MKMLQMGQAVVQSLKDHRYPWFKSRSIKQVIIFALKRPIKINDKSDKRFAIVNYDSIDDMNRKLFYNCNLINLES